jgi:hypothetical protein
VTNSTATQMKWITGIILKHNSIGKSEDAITRVSKVARGGGGGGGSLFGCG